MSKHNRKCPKCGLENVVGCIFGDAKQDYPFSEMGVICGNPECDWEVQLAESNP